MVTVTRMTIDNDSMYIMEIGDYGRLGGGWHDMIAAISY